MTNVDTVFSHSIVAIKELIRGFTLPEATVDLAELHKVLEVWNCLVKNIDQYKITDDTKKWIKEGQHYIKICNALFMPQPPF